MKCIGTLYSYIKLKKGHWVMVADTFFPAFRREADFCYSETNLAYMDLVTGQAPKTQVQNAKQNKKRKN